jgi:hypothetical protein
VNVQYPLRESVSGLVSDEYGEEVHAPTPSAENGVMRRWRHEGIEKRSRMANEVLPTETLLVKLSSDLNTGDPLMPHPKG